MAINYSLILTLAGDSGTAYIGTATISDLSTLYGTAPLTLGAATARAIAANFGASVNKRSGDVSIDASDKYKHYMDLATSLDRQAILRGLGSTSAYAGGISLSDKDTQESNTDRVPPKFTRNLHRDPSISDDVDEYNDLT